MLHVREFKFFGMSGNPVVCLATQAIIWALVITAIVGMPAELFPADPPVEMHISN